MADEIGLLHAWLDQHQDEMLAALQGLIHIPSKREAPAGPNAPFGAPVREALDYALDLCAQYGFRVKDSDGYAGHAEFGEGAEMVGVIGHLDVVPEGDQWAYPPFGAVVEDGYLYGRGAEDDKGPVVATIFAMRALKESGLPLRRRVRLIMGCDEESGFSCVEHYWDVAKEERPTVAFTPDACFPVIYAEKGISSLTVEFPIPESDGLRVQWARGGRRRNMVPDQAEALVSGDPTALLAALAILNRHWDRNVTAVADREGIRISAIGKAAHGSAPSNGDNAVRRLAAALATIDLPSDQAWIRWVLTSSDPTGAGLGIQGADDVAGPLTANLGTLEVSGGVAQAVYNIRYPVTWTVDRVLEGATRTVEAAGASLTAYTDSPPLYVPLDQEPVKTLLSVYRAETHDEDAKPLTMGGGTYARSTPNAVAFGATFPGGHDGPAHESNERIALETLNKASRIFAHALYELAR